MPARPNILTAHLIEEHSMPEPNSGCWLWMGQVNSRGYGRLSIADKLRLAHRLSWTVFRGQIPEGTFVLHHCDVRSCVNPDHLWLGNNRDNIIDCVIKGRGHQNATPKPQAFVGAYFVARRGRWQAQIRIDGKHIYLGRYPTRDEATAAYRRALSASTQPAA